MNGEELEVLKQIAKSSEDVNAKMDKLILLTSKLVKNYEE